MDFAERLARYRDHFPGPHLGMVVESMLAGNTAGVLWTIEGNSGPLLILWDRGNEVFYLAGDAYTDSSIEVLRATMDGEVLPRAQAAGVRRIKVRALSPSLEESSPHLFPGITLRPTITRFSVHDVAQQASVRRPRLSGVTFHAITSDLLRNGDLAHIGYVREEIRGMWPSEERFNAHGFGTLAVLGDEMICWCTAEYVGPTHCGIGIATGPAHQGEGVATATAGHFVREARARGLVPCWECDAANIASVRVAEKAGFVREAEEPYWIGTLPDAIA